MTQEDAVRFWLEAADEASQTAEDTYSAGHPNWAFFFWHLSIEKLLKGLITKVGEEIIPVHDLVKLALRAKISLSEKQRDLLSEISSYAISARYDDIKKSYYMKVTKPEYKDKWSGICREIIIWLKKQF